MAVGNAGQSVTERLENLGRAVGQREFVETRQSLQHHPDPMTRFTRMVQTSVRRQPMTWALIGLGVGAAIGATWLVADRMRH